MSNSIKKTKISGITISESEKAEKREANRKYRRTVKQKVKLGNDEFPKIRELSNVWCFSKDGKRYNAEMSAKYLRK
ncbi:MAG: hypothetical protein IPJ51_23050 [Saprospiraceae bacterium]|nr:hypothetical protein [Saprospiraceae bacterium]